MVLRRLVGNLNSHITVEIIAECRNSSVSCHTASIVGTSFTRIPEGHWREHSSIQVFLLYDRNSSEKEILIISYMISTFSGLMTQKYMKRTAFVQWFMHYMSFYHSQVEAFFQMIVSFTFLFLIKRKTIVFGAQKTQHRSNTTRKVRKRKSVVLYTPRQHPMHITFPMKHYTETIILKCKIRMSNQKLRWFDTTNYLNNNGNVVTRHVSFVHQKTLYQYIII